MAATAVAAVAGRQPVAYPSDLIASEQPVTQAAGDQQLDLPLSFNGKTCRFGWRTNTASSQFAQQLRAAAKHLTGREGLDGIQMLVDSPPIGGGDAGGASSSSAPPLKSRDKVIPRDIFQGRIGGLAGGSVRLEFPADSAPAVAPPAAATTDKRPCVGSGYGAFPGVVKPPITGSSAAGPPASPARLLPPQPAQPARSRGQFNGKSGGGGSQLGFIQMMSMNKNPKASLSPGTRLTFQEVMKHKKPGDCWTIYQNKVYDMTAYVDFHPGGKEELMKGAGKDMTNLFNKVHPWVSMDGFLGSLCLGQLEKPNPLAKAMADIAEKKEAAAHSQPKETTDVAATSAVAAIAV